MLRPATWHPFTAGQHLDFRLTAPDGYQAERSYSVTSPPERQGVVRGRHRADAGGRGLAVFPRGGGAGRRGGDRGPFGGHFAWEAGDGGPLLLIGGGSGVAPLMSILRHRAAVAPEVAATLVYAARGWDALLFRDELVERDRAEAGLRVVFALSREAPRRAGDFGQRVDAGVLRAVLDASGRPRTTFICGNNAFVETVAGHAVDLGLPAGDIRTERFGG